jgi:hypothetical protein
LSTSATFRLWLPGLFKEMLGLESSLPRQTGDQWTFVRSIDISINGGLTTKCILDSLAPYVEDNQTKVMIFCGTQKRAEGAMLDQIRLPLGNRGRALAFTRDTSVMEKSTIMALFDGSLQYAPCNLRVLTVASAATFGISSSKCRCVRYSSQCHSREGTRTSIFRRTMQASHEDATRTLTKTAPRRMLHHISLQ